MESIKKKILLLSTGDINGAYEAIYRLAKHFVSEKHEVKMLVKSKTKTDNFVVAYHNFPTTYRRKSTFERVVIKLKNKLFVKYHKNHIVFDPDYDFISKDELSVNICPERIVDLVGFVPEYIYTGMTNNFMNSTDLLLLQQITKAQVYNITVDMNHFTGGCHFAWDCKGYINGCDANCPAILSKADKGLAKLNFDIKLKNATEGNFKIIAGSGWTLKQAEESKIYKNQETIYNVNSLIETSVFNTKNRLSAKNIFNLDEGTFHILMGCQNANSKRKGFEYLLKALQDLHLRLDETQRRKIKVLIVSRSEAANFEAIPFEKQHIDYITDYRLLSLLYQATDVFVNSSIEDSGPLMVSEALACGTPVVGFDMGVVSNMVINDYNGYKAVLKDSSDLAKGIYTVFNLNVEEYKAYSKNAVSQVEKFSSMTHVKEVFNQIMKIN